MDTTTTTKPASRTRKAKERLQVLLNRDTKERVIELAEAEGRSEANMGEVLIKEALDARESGTSH
jgi:hypothetical protein